MTTLANDIKYGLRMLTKRPGVTIMMLLMLTVALAINAMVFSCIRARHRVAHRFKNPDRLAMLWRTSPGQQRGRIGIRDYLDWHQQVSSFTDMSLYGRRRGILMHDNEAQRVTILETGTTLLPTVGLKTVLGRVFTADDDAPQAAAVVILSHGLWQRRFSAEADVLGRTILLDGEPYSIVGVLQPEMTTQSLWRSADVLIPIPLVENALSDKERPYRVLARLKPEVSIEQAQVEMSTIQSGLNRNDTKEQTQTGVLVQPLTEFLRPQGGRFLDASVLIGVALVLVIASVNGASMQLARIASRSREFGIEMALGATRGRLMRRLFIEGLLLGVLAAVLGLLVAQWGIKLLLVLLRDVPYPAHELGLHIDVILYIGVLAVAAAVLFGLLPGLRISILSLSISLQEGLRQGCTGRGSGRLRNSLVVAQLAIAVPLLVCGAMLFRYVQGLRSMDLGFSTQGLLTMKLTLPEYRYTNDVECVDFMRNTLARIKTIPGIESAGFTSGLEAFGARSLPLYITVDNPLPQQNSRRQDPSCNVVSNDYFKTLGIKLQKGRYFNDHDMTGSNRVAIINQRLARSYWPQDDPLERHLLLNQKDVIPEPITIVGIVADAGCSHFGGPPEPMVYLPYGQHPVRSLTLVTRSWKDVSEMVLPIKRSIYTLDPQVAIEDIFTVKALQRRWLRDEHIAEIFLTTIATMALGLACIGLYGTMSYTVSQRTREFGIRSALGATYHGIQIMILKFSLRLSMIGLIVGLILALPVGFLLLSQLYRAPVADPVSALGVVLLFLTVTVLAGYFPARRAAKIDPMEALRYE